MIDYLRFCMNLSQCRRCFISPLCGNSINTHVVSGRGNVKASIMVVGEAPGRDEDRESKPFIGMSGRLLDKIIVEAGLKRDDLYVSNSVKCRPYFLKQIRGKNSISNRPPSKGEIAECKKWLWEEIQMVKPRVIVTVGKTAIKMLNGLEDDKFVIKDFLKPRVVSWEPRPTLIGCWHPSYLARKGEKEYREAVESFIKARNIICSQT